MPDIVELLTKSCGEISCDQCNDEREKAGAKILRLREGLRDLRRGITIDANVIDSLLKIVDTKDF